MPKSVYYTTTISAIPNHAKLKLSTIFRGFEVEEHSVHLLIIYVALQ